MFSMLGATLTFHSFTEATFPSQRAFMESRFVVLTEDIFAVAVAHMELQRAADKVRLHPCVSRSLTRRTRTELASCCKIILAKPRRCTTCW